MRMRSGRCTCAVGVIQLGNSLDLRVLDSGALGVELGLSFELDPVHDALHDATRGSLDEGKTTTHEM